MPLPSRAALVAVLAASAVAVSASVAVPASAAPLEPNGTPVPTAGATPSGDPTTDPTGTGTAGTDTGDVVLVAEVAPKQDLAQVARQAEQGPGSVTHVLNEVDSVSVQVPATQVAVATAQLATLPGVTGVTRAATRTFFDVPNDTDYAKQAQYYKAINAPAAWSRTHGDRSVRVAILDSGLDMTHPDLASKVVARYNVHRNNSIVTDTVGHGTFVAGVAAAATDNGRGVAGVGYDTSIMAVKIDYLDGKGVDQLSSADIARGVIWAANHEADVINLSLGSEVYDRLEARAVSYARRKGVLVVAAAGNEDSTVKNYPAAYPGVVAVGATNTQYGSHPRAGFSNHGSWVTLAAPGVGIHSTSPRAGSDFFGRGYATGDGTSFSSPLVAGAAALLLAKNPNATEAQLRAALVGSGDRRRGLDMGAGEFDVNAALDLISPPATPGVSGNSGVISFTATSDAPYVRYSVDGVPVTTAARGSAGQFASWGWKDGDHTVTAAACHSPQACGGTSAATTFSVSNAAPVVTAPAEGDRISGPTTFTATSTGGGVAFLVDGKRIGFDGTAPYSIEWSASGVDNGSRTVTAVGCSASGSRCAGRTSSPVAVDAESLHPTITSATSPFSPNGDRVRDTSVVGYYLPSAQTVRISVLNSSGTAVRGPAGFGTLSGRRSWRFDGRDAQGRRLPNGIYTVVIDTAQNGRSGQVSRNVVVDSTAPTLTSVTGRGATFYPVRDGYRDRFTPTVRLGERSTLALQIRTSRNAVVRTISAARNPGRTSFSWDGRNGRGRAVPAGTYRWVFIARDAAGNRRATSLFQVYASGKRLVTVSRALTRNGSRAFFDSQSKCTGRTASRWGRVGAHLINRCRPNNYQSAFALYQFTLPRAYSYVRLSTVVLGSSASPPSQVVSLLLREGNNDASSLRFVNIGSKKARAYRFGRIVHAANSKSRRVMFVLGVTSRFRAPSDFDIRRVALIATYRVLR